MAGGSGADTLVASAGSDVLTGGGGADRFGLSQEPWAPIHITDFTLGTDRLDLSALFRQVGYWGLNPVGDHYLSFVDDGAGGTKILFDPDGSASGHPWPDYIIDLEHVPIANLRWVDLNSGAAPPPSGETTIGSPPPPPPTSPPPPGDGGVVLTAQTTPATLTGGAGDDTLNASQGPDQLTGAGGADKFVWSAEPWAPAHVTDFVVGTDRLDLSALLQQAGYTGSDPVADHYLTLESDGAGGTHVLFDPDGAATAHQWPDYIINLDNTAVTTWAQLTGGAVSPPPPPSNAGVVLHGEGGGSNLQGGSGDDTLIGGTGPDTMTGAGGADHFVYQSAPWQGGQISDFTHGVDRIDVSGLLAGVQYAGSDPIADGYVRLYDDGHGGTWLYFDRDGAGTADQWGTFVATLQGVSPGGLTASDFIFH
jgi:Ca2+-binding RTX toxin-like protein